MIERCWRLFRQVRGGLRTKARLWESVCGLFKVQFSPTMDALLSSYSRAIRHLALLIF
jgi:hypothetical protein